MSSTGDTFRDCQTNLPQGADRPLDACQRMSDESYRFSSTSGNDRYLNTAQSQDRNLGYYPEIQPVTVAKDGGCLTIDEFNRVTRMQDAAHRQFQFGYDQKSGDLNAVSNDNGTWTRQKHHGRYTDEWKNENKESWKGDVAVTPNGYSFSSDNQRITYSPNGERRKDYLSEGQPYFSAITTADGHQKVRDYRLGAPVIAGAAGDKAQDPAQKPDAAKPTADHCPPTDKSQPAKSADLPHLDAVKGTVHFDVQKGETKSGRLQINSEDFSIVHSKGGDVHAQIAAPADAPVTAMQDGLVVYSYNHDQKIAAANKARGTSVIGLSPADMKVIDQFKKSNPDQDMVVMQCYDKASKGVRYEVYAGLGLANATPGERFKAGSVIGKSGDRGFEFAARRNAISGQAVELTF